MNTSQKTKLSPFKVPFIVSLISIIVMIVEMAAPQLFRSGIMRTVNMYLVPIICFQFFLFGLHILFNVKGNKKWLGLIGILLSVISYGLIASIITTENRMWVNCIMQFVPFTFDGTISLIVPFAMLFDNSVLLLRDWEILQVGMSAIIWLGIVAYFAIPKKIWKINIERYGLVRYFIALFIVPIITLIIVIAVLALMLWILSKIFIGDTSSSSSTRSATTQTSPLNEATDTRNYKTVILDGVRDGKLNDTATPTYITDTKTGREYRIFNYHKNTGYFEDENQNIYYYDEYHDFDNIKFTGKYRAHEQSEYDADNK